MQADDRLDRVRALRAQGRSPKQVAHVLGIRPAEAARLVRQAAAAAAAETDAPGPALVGCWISRAWSTGLSVRDHPDWPRDDDDSAGVSGLAAVLVARRHRFDKYSVCGYLVDTYCLGVKNALGPRIVDDVELRRMMDVFFEAFPGGPIEAPLELACDVVFGAVDYARGLGFEPHPDLAAAAGHLGPWTGPSAITFGRDGTPFYVSGPYEDPRRVIRTLERTVGAGNFDVMIGAG